MWFTFPNTKGLPLEEVAAIFGDADEVAVYQRDIHLSDSNDDFDTGLKKEKSEHVETTTHARGEAV